MARSVRIYGSVLAARAPVGIALDERGVPQHSVLDRGFAASAGQPGPTVEPARTTRPEIAGRAADRALAIGDQQPVGEGEGEGSIHVSHLPGRAARREPAQEAQLVGVLVADSGEVALLLECDENGDGRVGQQPAGRFCGIPVRPEQGRPEVVRLAVRI